jgi:tetratricopeptide (TPR) repeat protein
MLRTLKGAFLLAAAVGLCQTTASANGSGAGSSRTAMPSSSMAPRTPEERAIEAYRSGDAHRVKGRKLEAEASAKSGKDAAKATARARGEFEKALKDFKSAAQLNPQLFHAYNGMGYAYRKTGDFAKALEMYDQAIALAPGFYAEAVEYRAEAYLSLNRIDDARQAYLDLFAADRTQADALMAAMKKWVAERRAVPAGVDPAAVGAFEQWIGEREGIAKETRLMGVTRRYAGW